MSAFVRDVERRRGADGARSCAPARDYHFVSRTATLSWATLLYSFVLAGW
jgi:hypothetical protein